MTIFNWLILAFWLICVVYLIVSAIGVKKDIQGSLWQRVGVLLVIIVAFLLPRLPIFQQFSPYFSAPLNPVMNSIGVILCAAGIAFVIWSRWHLGKNWSMTPSIKERHELVTSGPYRYVRHPMYTGYLTALLGSAFVGGGSWLLLFVAFCVIFVRRVKVEEELLMRLFPREYPEYRNRTKILIPFVW